MAIFKAVIWASFFCSLSSALQYVQVGQLFAATDDLKTGPPFAEVFDTTTRSVCNASQSYHDFTANHHREAGVNMGMFRIIQFKYDAHSNSKLNFFSPRHGLRLHLWQGDMLWRYVWICQPKTTHQ